MPQGCQSVITHCVIAESFPMPLPKKVKHVTWRADALKVVQHFISDNLGVNPTALRPLLSPIDQHCLSTTRSSVTLAERRDGPCNACGAVDTSCSGPLHANTTAATVRITTPYQHVVTCFTWPSGIPRPCGQLKSKAHILLKPQPYAPSRTSSFARQTSGEVQVCTGVVTSLHHSGHCVYAVRCQAAPVGASCSLRQAYQLATRI